MNAYALKDLRVGHDGQAVLSVPDLAIPAGSVTALLGANGVGKSTLLHALALLTPPLAGSVVLFGEAVTRRNRSRLRGHVSLLLQSPYLFDRSVAANVTWGLRARGVAGSERAARAAEALEMVGLKRFARRPARALSGGEAQRLALARLLALRPKVMLVDEPTAHVDRDSRARIEAILEEWVRDNRTTVVLATHDMALAERLEATRLAVAGGTVSPG